MYLLLYECNGIQQYTTIKRFSRLISGQLSNHNAATYCCKKYLHAYSSKELLAEHAADCCHVQTTKFPKDPRCRFTNIQRQLPGPFVVYADFESILKPVNEDVHVTQGVSTGLHLLFLRNMFHADVDPDFTRPLVIYRGEDAADMFVRKLQLEAEQLFDEHIVTPKAMRFTATNSRPLPHRKLSWNCPQCLYRFTRSCWKLPVVIHNLKGYDGHLIVKALKSEFGKVRVIPQDMEKYLSLTVGQLKFIDSLQFTNQSLDSLVDTLDNGEFRYFVESFTTSHFNLARRKCVYPYDYMDSVERFEETALPSQDAFFNKLSGSSCLDSEYTHATRMWDAFGCETIADYHNVYLQLDVFLLADFFEQFHRTCLEFYGLDPLHYYTTPGLAWDAALRMSNVDLELITDENMCNFVENSIRGGISMIASRYARANNPSFPSTNFPDKTSSIWMQIICMGGQCRSFCLHMVFASSVKMRSLHLDWKIFQMAMKTYTI